MKYLVALLALLFTLPAQAGWKFLEKETLHSNPLAYPRSPALGVSVNTSEYEGQQVVYADAILGGQVGIVSYYMDRFAFQLGAEAGGWLTLGHREGTSFAMLTEDFIVSFPLSFRWADFSAAVKWNHISAHLGDGMSTLLEEDLRGGEKKEFEFYEDLAEDEGMDLNLVEPFAYSRDFFSLLLSYEYNLDSYQLRSYLHSGYAHKMTPEELGRWFVGGGTEIKWWADRGSPFTAIDLTWNQDTDSVDFSSQVGWMVKPSWDAFTFYVALNGFIGQDRRGQLYGHDLKRIGIGFYVR